jgi:nicotinamidase-related amidase
MIFCPRPKAVLFNMINKSVTSMIKKYPVRAIVLALSLCALTACSTVPTTTQSPASSVPLSSAATIPNIPAPAQVAVDAKTSALLILDINTAVCQPNPACTATVPAIASLLNKARAAKVPVIYSTTVNPAGPPATLAAVAPQPGEPVVVSRANKFTDTDLEGILKQRNVGTLVIVGSAANGAVMYTAFHANTRGFTVVVAEDGLSSPVPVNTQLALYQLLNQPGLTNGDNTSMADKKVTLSRSDLITFR